MNDQFCSTVIGPVYKSSGLKPFSSDVQHIDGYCMPGGILTAPQELLRLHGIGLV